MGLGIRAKLLIASFVAVVVVAWVVDMRLSRAIELSMRDTLRDNLFVRAELVAQALSVELLQSAEPEHLAEPSRLKEALVRRLAASARSDVTVVRGDGVILGDSTAGPAGAAHGTSTAENLALAPEMVGALGPAGRGWAEHAAAAGSPHELRVAVVAPLDVTLPGRASDGQRETDGTDRLYIVRLVSPASGIDDAVGHARQTLLIAALFLFGLAALLSTLVTARLFRVVGEITTAARRMTAGDLDVRTRVSGSDEVAELGAALDQLAGTLSVAMSELRDERDLHSGILEGMQEGVVVLDRDDRVAVVNPAARAMFLLGADVRGRLLMEVVRYAELERILRAARADGKVSIGEIDLPGIKPRRLLVHAAPLRGGSGGLLAVLVDVTDLRRLESLRRDFVANVSHELRTPVTAVLTAAETLRESALGDRAAALRFVDMIDRNAQRLQSLIDDLLELSRLESKEFKLKKAQVDVATVVGIVLGLFRERAEKKGVRLTADVSAAPATIDTDQRALEQVLMNLVDNAVKYCPSGASVTLVARSESGGVVFIVEDTGPGIPEAHLPRVFERFYRVDAGRSRQLGGTGLGLSIVKHLAEALGGRVTVDSTLGQGSTFVVRLPGPAPARRSP